MNNQSRYLSIRWKIILLAASVLGLTSFMFIWQEYELQRHKLEIRRTEFREHGHIVLEYLLRTQASRLLMTGNQIIEQPQIADDLSGKRSDNLIGTVQALSPVFTPLQNILSVIFYDENQRLLAVWGESVYADETIPHDEIDSRLLPSQQQILCKQICVQRVSLPILLHGKRVGSMALIGDLGQFMNDLRRLTQSDFVLVKSRQSGENAPLHDVNIVSDTSQISRDLVTTAMRSPAWSNGFLEMEHAGQVYQILLLNSEQFHGGELHPVLIMDITSRMQLIENQSIKLIISGLFVFILGLCLLYFILRPAMARFSHLNRMLSMLGNEQMDFHQIRAAYATRPGNSFLGDVWLDEVDELESIAMDLSERLQRLHEESILHIDSVEIQARHLKQERDFISSVLNTAPVLILSYCEDGTIRLGNVRAMQIIGQTDLTGKNFAELFIGITPQAFSTEIAAINSGGVHRMESILNTQDGRSHSLLWFSSRLPDGRAERSNYLSIGMDITELKKNEARIYNMAFFDMLTQLPNRRMLLDSIRHAMSSSGEEKTHCAIIFLDLDNFKAVNDSRGQNVGDMILVEIAKRLRGNVREFDTVAHLGVDEFVILLEELSEDQVFAAAQARQIGEKLRGAVSLPIELHDHSYHVTCSAGISLFINHEVTADAALRQANIAMTFAKTSGRNALRFFDPEMQLKLEARTILEADLRRAITEKQFLLFYQLQTNAEGDAIGAEALVRWIHPEHGVISPDKFIPFAEESVLMVPLGQWLLETACALLTSWESDELTSALLLAVNVSPRQFHQPDFVEQVKRTLKQTGANPARLKLELTESVILEDIQDAVLKMLELKKLGVQFSIDDFGTAYSSLSYLTQLPVDQLKIDQSFVRNIGVRGSDDIVVETIINMANNLGMQVIAEGVETEAQFRFLKQAGCTSFQGYLFSKPLELKEFLSYLIQLKGESK